MNKNIYIAIERSDSQIEQLKKLGGVNLFFPKKPQMNKWSMPTELADKINILFCEIPPDNIKDMKSLELVQISSTGYSQLFPHKLHERKIKACNGRGEFDIPIAEWAIAMMVNLARDVRGMIRNQEHGIWERPARFQSEVRGRTLGLFGYGSLARELARLAKCMGINIHAYDREKADFSQRNYYSVEGTGDPHCLLPDKFFYPGEELDFMSGLDFIAIAMPLTNATEGVITLEHLRALPKGAYLLNFARGPIIQESALLTVLREGHLGGAALDVHYRYPMAADDALWRFPNVIMTPHISGSTASTNFIVRIYDIFVQNVRRFLTGEALINELSDTQLAGN